MKTRDLLENQEMLDSASANLLGNPKLVNQLAVHWRHDPTRPNIKLPRDSKDSTVYTRAVAQLIIEKIDELLKQGYGGVDFIRGSDWKIYKEFLVKLYAVGGALWEDLLTRGIQTLYQWDLMKKYNLLDLKHTNLFNFTSLSQLEFILENFYSKQINKLADAQRLLDHQQQAKMLTIASTPEYELMIPLNHSAAVMGAMPSTSSTEGINLKDMARWCTAFINNPYYFKQYTASGPLVIIHARRPRNSDSKALYQLHGGSGQFMNALDNPVRPAEAQKRFPNLGQDLAKAFREHAAEISAAGYNPTASLAKIQRAFAKHLAKPAATSRQPRAQQGD